MTIKEVGRIAVLLRSYDRKIVKAGDIIEVYEYEKQQICGYQDERKTGRAGLGEVDEAEMLRNRLKVQQRARRELRRLINANAGRWKQKTKFFTLTFAENVNSLDKANAEWKKFRRRIDRRLGYKLEYVVVVEFQDRGAVHYHAVLFNMPYMPVKELAELWGQGFVKVNAVEEVDNIGSYVCKYMGKDLQDDRLKGQKCYFSSRGLYKPEEVTERKLVEQLEAALPAEAKVYENSFDNEYTGKILYKQYNLNRAKITTGLG